MYAFHFTFLNNGDFPLLGSVADIFAIAICARRKRCTSPKSFPRGFISVGGRENGWANIYAGEGNSWAVFTAAVSEKVGDSFQEDNASKLSSLKLRTGHSGGL